MSERVRQPPFPVYSYIFSFFKIETGHAAFRQWNVTGNTLKFVHVETQVNR